MRRILLKRILKITLFIILICLESNSKACAASTSDSAQNKPENGYTVAPAFGITQKKETSNFYDMTLQPKQEDTFKLTITNGSQKPQQYKINVNTAMTNSNGIVDYTKESFEKDSSMNLMLNDIVTPSTSEVDVAGRQSQTIDFHIAMPDQPFDGILLGGITIRPITTTQNKGGIQNVYMHTIAIRVGEKDTSVQNKLEGGSVRLGQINRHNIVSMSIRNPQPKLLSKLEGDFSINKKGGNKELIHEAKKNLSIAPNTKFELPIFLKDHFKPGKYTYTIKLKNSEDNWTFSKDFTIKKKEADKYNARSVDEASHKFAWWKYLLIVFPIIVLCIIFYRFGKRRGKN